jgi:L-asparaginase
VCVIHVGGTIGMTRDETGSYRPQPGFLAEYMSAMPELALNYLPEYELLILDPLLDSAEMKPSDWVRIAETIVQRHEDFDGFVVVHGTDTMAYTASALSFLIEGLSKPVILTGAQLTLAHPRSDGREHLITSLSLAGRQSIPEVCIYFASSLLRGNRAQKVHNRDFVAFDAGNLLPLARVGVNVEFNEHLFLEAQEGPARVVAIERDPQVAAIRLFPGMGAQMLENMIGSSLDAVVLETYGAGNAPSNGEWLGVLERAVREDDLVVVNCSQCHGGAVVQDLYAAGASLASAGVVSGRDMTPEAALTKLYCLLAQGLAPAEVRVKMGHSLAGELAT